jgi:hypothetical protein
MTQHGSAARALTRLVGSGLVALLMPLAGCATAYHPETVTGGYTEIPLAETTYQVRFKGNNYTPRDQVEQFLLYRCAELTEQLGYEHFLLVAADTLDISDPLAKAGLFPRNYYATARIKVFRRADHPAAYNAKEVRRRVEEQYPEDFGA